MFDAATDAPHPHSGNDPASVRFKFTELLHPMEERTACGSATAVLRHWQRGGRSKSEIVTVVMRFLRTTMSHSTAIWPPPAGVASFAVPTRWRKTAVPFLGGSSFTE